MHFHCPVLSTCSTFLNSYCTIDASPPSSKQHRVMTVPSKSVATTADLVASTWFAFLISCCCTDVQEGPKDPKERNQFFFLHLLHLKASVCIRLKFSPDFHSGFSTPFREFESSVSLFPEASFLLFSQLRRVFCVGVLHTQICKSLYFKEAGKFALLFPGARNHFLNSETDLRMRLNFCRNAVFSCCMCMAQI